MSGDTQFDAFVRANWAELLAIGVAASGSRSDAEDLVQSCLLSAFQRWDRLREGEQMRYLRRSILNAQVSRWRKVLRHERSTDAIPADRRASAGLEHAELRMDLVVQLQAVPARQRAVLVLRYLCDLPDQEVADTLGISPGAVRSQAHRGLAKLRHDQHELAVEPRQGVERT